MDSYLDIAETVLRVARRPLTPQAILKAAYRSGIVPPHLYGKTQHKTLHARLSEDILCNRLESRFFRTDPGCFFLSELRSDPTIPDRFKDPFHARRRTRDLGKDRALALERQYALQLDASRLSRWHNLLKEANAIGALKYANSRMTHDDLIFVWAFSIVRRDDQLLCYRIGRYRDDRDAFANRKTIGFVELVGYDNSSLFTDDMGITECGLNAVLTDLDLSKSAFSESAQLIRPSISFARLAIQELSEPVLLFIMEWQCPDWFEPTARRLSLNDVHWISATHMPNDIDAYEPWSVTAMAALQDYANLRPHNGQKNTRRSDRVY